MTDGERLVMHATLTTLSGTAKANGTFTRKVGFDVPRGYVEWLDRIADVPVELWWNEEKIADGARCASSRMIVPKHPDEDVSYRITFDITNQPPLVNLWALGNQAGDLQVASNQLPLFGQT
jgi:hypothetical protein